MSFEEPDEPVALDYWRQYIEFCNQNAKANRWFRGVTHREHLLVPRIGRPHQEIDWNWGDTVRRNNREINLLNREKRVLDAFKRRAVLDLRFMPANTFQWLALAQHHGVPTRLLDWTTNPLMAAWFAISKPDMNEGDVARVYALFISSKRKIHEDDVEPFNVRTDAFVVAPHWHPRVRAQRGCFSIHPEPQKPLEPTKGLTFFDIPQPFCASFRRRLYYFGIDASTVMGDLAGLGGALQWQYESEIGIGQVGY